jgi:predicted phosphodiesterase
MANINTRIFIMSDTHGSEFEIKDAQQAHVVIHCGDLTEQSKIEEVRSSLRFLQSLKAPLKLVIPGNHDFTLDEPTFGRNIASANPPFEPALVAQEFGEYGEARRLFDEGLRSRNGQQTLFVNAAIEGARDECLLQPAWLVDIDLKAASS